MNTIKDGYVRVIDWIEDHPHWTAILFIATNGANWWWL